MRPQTLVVPRIVWSSSPSLEPVGTVPRTLLFNLAGIFKFFSVTPYNVFEVVA